MTDLIAFAPASTVVAPVKIPMVESGPDTAPLPKDQPTGPLGDGSYLFRMVVPSELWVIFHDLGAYPDVTVQDNVGELTEATLEHLSINSLRIRFGAPCGGVAFLTPR